MNGKSIVMLNDDGRSILGMSEQLHNSYAGCTEDSAVLVHATSESYVPAHASRSLSADTAAKRTAVIDEDMIPGTSREPTEALLPPDALFCDWKACLDSFVKAGRLGSAAVNARGVMCKLFHPAEAQRRQAVFSSMPSHSSESSSDSPSGLQPSRNAFVGDRVARQAPMLMERGASETTGAAPLSPRIDDAPENQPSLGTGTSSALVASSETRCLFEAVVRDVQFQTHTLPTPSVFPRLSRSGASRLSALGSSQLFSFTSLTENCPCRSENSPSTSGSGDLQRITVVLLRPLDSEGNGIDNPYPSMTRRGHQSGHQRPRSSRASDSREVSAPASGHPRSRIGASDRARGSHISMDYSKTMVSGQHSAACTSVAPGKKRRGSVANLRQQLTVGKKPLQTKLFSSVRRRSRSLSFVFVHAKWLTLVCVIGKEMVHTALQTAYHCMMRSCGTKLPFGS